MNLLEYNNGLWKHLSKSTWISGWKLFVQIYFLAAVDVRLHIKSLKTVYYFLSGYDSDIAYIPRIYPRVPHDQERNIVRWDLNNSEIFHVYCAINCFWKYDNVAAGCRSGKIIIHLWQS